MSSVGPRSTRRGRRHDKSGRSIGSTRFLKLDHWILKTPAWRSLPPSSRALYVELAQRFNGSNNGEISMSVREAADLVNIAKDTAMKCFHELEAKGFVRRRVCGSFDWKLKHATTWILTGHPLGDQAATKDFARWVPEKSEVGPKSRTQCPKPRTERRRFRSVRHVSVPALGPWTRCCTGARSQSAARI